MVTLAGTRREIGEALGQFTAFQVEREVRFFSSTLAGSYNFVFKPRSPELAIDTVEVRTPYQWAGILNDGRRRVRARPGGVLVYWRRPQEDPRYRGGRPFTTAGRRLTRAMYERAKLENRLARLRGVPEDRLPVVFVREVGRAEGKRFLEKARPFVVGGGRGLIQARLNLFTRARAKELIEPVAPGGVYRLRVSF